ncbi:protein-L-isoaspartate O-methyltransferase domain-containing protein 1 [Tribolium castaneum]|uniref:Protein-L-isoaspartate O-methyltransferase domain-containing protein 1-like Protein n=1 Tax=Tribolium castaneum TaxID=7070 RepID=D6X168_TRICA|nr:PREDICTED: protein-L-isoaspartate O-methyltransferase domain-containing protein 1 [Tribolium castaneum]EFA09382.1 Protein-L-isoaspartate O-methyltransferase domain-containing protein 1-like Protein [Tribolium castaneum]|eukprot:XP_968084.1 PREDICTED: protein-L-isoaspartate O-methyltransferase domain-containing protein 1 [Tribolium castaneum]
MGAGVSAGENNDDLIDNLIEANYIKTASVERVFRAVDRGAYLLPEPPADAYRDVAWKNGNFHISAPCIYSEVMEGLKLRPGLSFLNLGSGTGYLNTVAGLILGSYGINHGIELHDDVIQYAYLRLEEFKKHSGAIDEYDFCEPKFMQGNCLCLVSGYHLYDRVYCGAACPEKYLSHIKNLIKVGGILVVPINERLVEMRRVSETSWSTHYLLPVSFTSLVKPEQGSQEIVPTFDIEPLSLQELCRTTIRNLLRKIIEIEHPAVKNVRKTRKTSKKKKPLKKNGRKDTNPKTSEELLDFFLLTIARKKRRDTATADRDNSSSSANNDDDSDGPSSDSDDSSLDDPLETMQEAFHVLDRQTNHVVPSTSNSDEAGSSKQSDDVKIESNVIIHREAGEERAENKVSYNITVEPMLVEEQNERKNNRDKFDSGLGDELLISELPVDMVEAMSSSSDDEQSSKRCKRGLKEKEKRLSSKWRKIERVDTPKKCDSDDSSDNDDKSDSESDYVDAMNRMKMYMSPYSGHMKSKIQQLPLPSNVKKFLNFYREF